jgi:peptidoglycan/xylan/chitin deacetylase (PgdA/CDA1 family)
MFTKGYHFNNMQFRKASMTENDYAEYVKLAEQAKWEKFLKPAKPAKTSGAKINELSQPLESVADVDSLDWKGLSANEITARVTKKVQSGSIVLFHNAALHTPEALPGIIKTLLQEGYSFVPISKLILSGDYTIDHTGRQCPA